MLIKFKNASELVYNVGSPRRYGECLLLSTTIDEGIDMKHRACVESEMAIVCRDFCPRYEECPMFYRCKIISTIGDRIEDILDDHSDLGVEQA